MAIIPVTFKTSGGYTEEDVTDGYNRGYSAGNTAGYNTGYSAGQAASGRIAYQFFKDGQYGETAMTWTAARAGERLVVIGMAASFGFSARANSGTKLIYGPAAGSGMRGYVFEATRSGSVNVVWSSSQAGSAAMGFRVY